MDALDPRSIRKGSKIRLDNGPEVDAGYVGGTVGHINPNGFVIIDHMGTFAVQGLTLAAVKGYHFFRLTEHTPPKPDPLALAVSGAATHLNVDESAEVAEAVRSKFFVLDRSGAHIRTIVDALAEVLPLVDTETLSRAAERVKERLLLEEAA